MDQHEDGPAAAAAGPTSTDLESLSMDLAEHGGLRYAERIDISAWSGRGTRPSDAADDPGTEGPERAAHQQPTRSQ